MPVLSIKQLRQRGVSDENIEMAKQIRSAQQQTGQPVQTLAEICGMTGPAARPAVDMADITNKAVRGARSYAELMAIYARLTALEHDASPHREKMRFYASQLETLSGGIQIAFEFSIWKGNTMTAHQYLDAMIARLNKLQKDGYVWEGRKNSPRKMSDANRLLCMAVLQLIGRHLEWQGPRCEITATEISETLEIQKMQVSRALAALEEIGAIVTGPAPHDRRKKIIMVTPEGLYRGRMSRDRAEHAEAVADFETEKARIMAGRNPDRDVPA